MRAAPALDRRRLLQLAAASAAALWLPRAAWSQPRLAGDPFALGVASGSPAADSVVLWTRLVAPELQGPVTVRWEVAHDEQFTRIARAGVAQALPELAHSVHVEAAGLEPDRWYFYRFMAGDAASPTGRTRTFPLAEAMPQRLRVAYASCQRWEHGFYAAHRHMHADAPDVVLFLGDYIYEYPGAQNAVRPVPDARWTLTLDDYRARYALHKSDADLRAMHAACPWIVTWDDHEVQNDYAADEAGDAGPAVADFPARRAAAYQAFYEHMPVRAAAFAEALSARGAPREVRLYGEHRFGRLAQLCVLDPRQYKSPLACTPGGKRGSGVFDPTRCAATADPARSVLGAAQERWLEERFAAGGATWTVLGQGSLFGPRDLKAGTGQQFWNDGWDGYPAARRRLVEALRRHAVANPVMLAGDVHENWVGHVLADYARPDSERVGVEFCGTSITSRAFRPDLLAERWADNPHFVHADAERRGYGIADFTPRQLQVQLRVLDDVARADSGISTQARFVVERGRPVLERA